MYEFTGKSVTPRRIAAFVLAAATAACGDSTAPRGGLTQREAEALALQLSGVASAASGGSVGRSIEAPQGSIAFAVVPSPVNLGMQTTVACPKGGSAKVSVTIVGTIDQTTQSITADVTGSFVPTGCAVTADAVTLTLSGSPGLATATHVSVVNGQPTGLQTLSVTGGFAWTSSDGRSGSCTVDYKATADAAANKATLTGSVCGTVVDYSGPLS
jgi:hypothetical protein